MFVAGGCSYFQSPSPNSDSYEKKIYQGSPITETIKGSFPNPIRINDLCKYFKTKIASDNLRPFLDRFNFPAEIEEDVDFFCEVLSKQFALLIEKSPNEADDIMLVEYRKLLIKSANAITIEKSLRKSEDFDSIFISVPYSEKPATINDCGLNLFHLNHANSRFVFDTMESFLVENIASYVQDRMTIDQHEKANTIGALWTKAIGAFQKAKDIDACWLDDELGNILIYAFLEQVLGAPKLFNKIELLASGHGQTALSGGGVHLYNAGNNTAPSYQLVFGKSNITDDIKTAIDNSLLAVKNIVNGMNSEMLLIDNPILSAKFPTETAKLLADTIIPQKSQMDKSFGVFLGYSLSLPSVSNADFRAALTAKMQTDITAHAKYIADRIIEEELDNYSFSFYFLPFNDADKEKKSIMNNILLGGT